jgi:TRAP transporter TAXI family solute receptor
VLVLTSFSSLLAIILGLVAAGAVAFRYLERPWSLRIAAGPSGSPDAAFADAVRDILPRGIGLQRIEVLHTESAAASGLAIDEGRADLAVVRSDDPAGTRAAMVLIVHKDAAVLLAGGTAKIAKVADLKGKRIAVVPGTGPNGALLDTILLRSGVLPATVQHLPATDGELADLAGKKLVDAAFVVGPLGDPRLAEAARNLAAGNPRPASPIEIKDAEALTKTNAGLEKIEVPAGYFRASPEVPAEDLSTVAVSHHLVARATLSDATVTALTTRLFLMRNLLAERAPIARFMEAADDEKGGPFPLHPGAAAYYGDNEKSFMDRYGDWIYIAAMVLGGLGSALATFVSSWQARARRAAMAIVDELVNLEEKARTASTAAQLSEYEFAVDAAAIRALRGARENRFDEAGLEAVRLAIDEVRHCVDREKARLAREAPTSVRALPARPA